MFTKVIHRVIRGARRPLSGGAMKGRPLSIVRIYLRRRSRKTGGVLKRMFSPQLARHLVEQALKSGVLYATATLGEFGFVQQAKRVAYHSVEVAVERLPSCVELVATADVLERFLSAHRDELDDATIVLLDGVEVSLTDLGSLGASA